jgi:peptidoglycan L-alanyl-D-glutamate endopeptidase CwlK
MDAPTIELQADPAAEPQPENHEYMMIGDAKVLLNTQMHQQMMIQNAGFQDYLRSEAIKVSSYVFGAPSKLNMAFVYPPLVQLTSFALQLSTQDFGIVEGLRTTHEQQRAVAKGTSRTMHSMHLMQSDGWAHAVDLVPWIGHYTWDWNRIYNVAAAMHLAAKAAGVGDRIRWGGAWDRRLSDFGDSPKDFASGVKAYALRHQGSDLLDGPHFEWVLG